jgi:hypothetical protein
MCSQQVRQILPQDVDFAFDTDQRGTDFVGNAAANR